MRGLMGAKTGPVLIVLLAIVLFWYAMAIVMNAPWQNTLNGRANLTDVPFTEFALQTFAQDKPVLPAPHQVVGAIWTGLFGAAITGANLLGAVDWAVAAFALLTLFLVRPATAWISLLGRSEPAVERAVIAFFGIRGIGSAYYLAYGLGHADFEQEPRLWSAVALTVLISIGLHGMTVTPVMRWLDRRASGRDVSC